MKDKDKERIKKFIELQNKDLKFEDIALELGIAKQLLEYFWIEMDIKCIMVSISLKMNLVNLNK